MAWYYPNLIIIILICLCGCFGKSGFSNLLGLAACILIYYLHVKSVHASNRHILKLSYYFKCGLLFLSAFLDIDVHI